MSKFVPNSFQVPNAFVDEVLNQISDAACKLYLVICRKTRGWNKEIDSISLTQLEEITGKSRPTVIKAKNELVKVGLLVELESTIHGNTYKLGDETSIGLVMNFPSKEILPDQNVQKGSQKSLPLLVKNFNYASKNILPLLVKNLYTQSNTIKKHYQNKKINKKSEQGVSQKTEIFDAKNIELPEHVNRVLWNQFVEMRNSKKKPLSENAVELLIKKLNGFGETANESLEYSIIGGYQGLFAIKQTAPVNPNQNTQQQQRRRFGQQAESQEIRTVGGICS